MPTLTRGFRGLRPRLAVRGDPGRPPALVPLPPGLFALAGAEYDNVSRLLRHD